MNFLFIVLVILILLVAWAMTCYKVVQQAEVFIVERLGAYYTTWGAGLHFRMPIIDRVVRKISLKEQVSDFEPQAVITKDNVTMSIDTVVYWRVVDSQKFTYNIERPIAAIENLTSTTLRNIIGDLTLDETLTSRDTVNAKMLGILDEATNGWGIDITRVELQNINPPQQIKEAMERQSKAERERRAVVIEAEGKKQAAITEAEGEKESAILKADAVKERMIREAQGKAQAIVELQKAEAQGLVYLNEAKVDKSVISLKSLEALKDVANGQATKIIIPSELQNLAGLVTSLKEIDSDK